MSWNKWDIESGICPNGHKIEDCMTLYWNKNQGRFKRRCKLKRRDRSKEAMNQAMKKTNFMLAQLGPVWEHESQGRDAHIELVCGHRTIYSRRAIEVNELTQPGDLWCDRCVEWKKAHRVSNTHHNKPSWIYFPREVSNV